MSGLKVAALLLLGTGLVGYAIAFAFVLRLRRWLGSRGQGWIRILTNGLLWLLAVLGGIFALSFASNLGAFRTLSRGWALALSFGVAGALAIAPWGLIAGLQLWRRRARRVVVAEVVAAGEQEGGPSRAL